MAATLHLLEPAPSARWAPFAGVRPVAELRAGAWRPRERWSRALGIAPVAIMADGLDEFRELDEPAVRPVDAVDGPAVVACSDFAVAGAIRVVVDGVRRLASGGRTAAWIVPGGERWEGPHEEGPAAEIEGVWLDGAVDLVTALERLLGEDCLAVVREGADPLPAGCHLLGDPALLRLRGALVEPGVLFDVRKGPIVLEPEVEVRFGARLEGPLYAARGTRLLGGAIGNATFGPRCNARGEIHSSVFVGYCNKGHDGFVGHSVLGHWVNLGAGTTTSNLKNTYGEVRLEVGGERVPSGRTFVGTLFGDHAKTAIGTMLSTGSIVCAGANVFGGPPPKYVAPFAWGVDGNERLTEDGFLRIAERVLPRRDVSMTPERRASLAALYRRATTG
jgi:UDP-N-acetylglucosamine diphosphorylase/glucosamine-1-phosphate N-acetyltransferase